MVELISELKLLFFAVGTLAFFANVYLSIKHPELEKAPQPALEDAASASVADTAELAGTTDWRKWDKAATWIMWGGWGIAALITMVARSGYLEILEL